MCQLFINADCVLWSSSTKSLRIEGVVTSIRLEQFFWDVLNEIAVRDQMSVNQLITKLYLESLDADHDRGNFTSFLRVCCARYLSLIADGALGRDEATALAELDAIPILQKEDERTRVRKNRLVQNANKSLLN